MKYFVTFFVLNNEYSCLLFDSVDLRDLIQTLSVLYMTLHRVHLSKIHKYSSHVSLFAFSLYITLHSSNSSSFYHSFSSSYSSLVSSSSSSTTYATISCSPSTILLLLLQYYSFFFFFY